MHAFFCSWPLSICFVSGIYQRFQYSKNNNQWLWQFDQTKNQSWSLNMFFCWFVSRDLDISSRQFAVFVFESLCICGGRQAGETGAYALSGQRSSTHFELDPKSPTALHLIGIGWGEGSWWSDLAILTMWNMDELDNYVRDAKFMIKMIILITKLPTDMVKFTGHFLSALSLQQCNTHLK